MSSADKSIRKNKPWIYSKGHTTLDLCEGPTAAGLGPRTSRALEAICSTLGRGKVSAITRGPRREVGEIQSLGKITCVPSEWDIQGYLLTTLTFLSFLYAV